MDFNKLASIQSTIAFESEVISLLRDIVGSENLIHDVKEIMSRFHDSSYIPDAIIKEGTYTNLSLFGDTSKKLLIEVCYKLTSVKLNSIIKFCEQFKDVESYNYLIICKQTSMLGLKTNSNFNIEIKDLDWLNTFKRTEEEQHESSEEKTKSLEIEKDDVLDKAKLDLQSGNYSFFLGAGISMDAGLPSWSAFMKNLIRRIQSGDANKKLTDLDYADIEEQCFHSSIIVGQFLKEYGCEEDIKKYAQESLYEAYNQKANKTQNLIDSIIDVIEKQLPQNIITYNYDDLIEASLLGKGKFIFDTITGATIIKGSQLPIYHVHGYIPNPNTVKLPEDIVLTEESYHKIYQEPFHWSNIVQLNALNHTVCFFIGLSMSDPNLRRLLDISMKNRTSGNDNNNPLPQHYVFLRRQNLKKTCPECHKNKSNEEVQGKIMNRLGLNVIWYDNFEELPMIIKSLV